MKNPKSSKVILIILLVLVESLLIGAGWFAVGLRNVDEEDPLVKIDAIIGGVGMPDPSKIPQSEQENEDDKVDPSEDKEDEDTVDVKPTISTEIKVKVRGTTILINDGLTPDSAFETRFNGLYDRSKQVILIDDFADFQTYSRLIIFFDDNGIRVKEEQSQK